jgi:hypothetical protein
MKRQAIGAIAILLAFATVAHSGDGAGCGPAHRSFLQRLQPVGGCNPGGGLFHWWNPCCLPSACGPNDYCRKPMPNVCRFPVAPACLVPAQPQPPVPVLPPQTPR